MTQFFSLHISSSWVEIGCIPKTSFVGSLEVPNKFLWCWCGSGGKPITLSLRPRVNIELGCDNSNIMQIIIMAVTNVVDVTIRHWMINIMYWLSTIIISWPTALRKSCRCITYIRTIKYHEWISLHNNVSGKR